MGHIEQLKNPNGSLSQNGMWKLKSKLCTKNNEVPHAKVGLDGQLVTAPEKLKDLYLVTYKDRLRHRKIDTKYEDIYIFKSNLWNYLLNECLQKKFLNWEIEELENVFKHLKANKSRDPLGIINELFKPNCIGEGLKQAMLNWLNLIKFNMKIPDVMKIANISIYKAI